MAHADIVTRSPASLLPILVVVTALGPFAMQIFLPALPVIQDDFGVGAVQAQLVFSMSAFAIALATLIYGPLSDAIGRRPAMLAGALIFAAGSLLCALAPSIEWLIVGRIIQAAGGCAGMVLGRAVIRDVYDTQSAASAIAYVTMAMVAAPMMAPVLGGYLTDLFDWRMIFWLGIAVGFAVLAAIFWQLPETHNSRGGGGNTLSAMRTGFAVLIRSPAFRAYALQAGFSMSVFFAFLGGAPYVMLKVFGLSATDYGLLFITISFAFMMGNFFAARLTRMVGIDRMIVIGSTGTLTGALLSLLCVQMGWFAHWGIFGPMLITALFQGLAVPNAQAAMVSVHPEIAGTASGLGGFVQMATAAVMAQIIGSIQIGSAVPMVVGMALASIMALFFALRARAASGSA